MATWMSNNVITGTIHQTDYTEISNRIGLGEIRRGAALYRKSVRERVAKRCARMMEKLRTDLFG